MFKMGREKRGPLALELWCRQLTDGYPNVSVNNMTTSWRNGLAFCALIHRFRPDLIDFEKLDPSDIIGNCSLAFETAESKLGIPALLDPEDMAAHEVPDRLSVLTYVAQFYSLFKNAEKKSSVPMGLHLRREKEDVDLKTRSVDKSPQSNSEKIADPFSSSSFVTSQKRRFESSPLPDPKKSFLLSPPPCAVCSNPVYLSERTVFLKRIYHRKCFRCDGCGVLLNPQTCDVSKDSQHNFCISRQCQLQLLRCNRGDKIETGSSSVKITDPSLLVRNSFLKKEAVPPTENVTSQSEKRTECGGGGGRENEMSKEKISNEVSARRDWLREQVEENMEVNGVEKMGEDSVKMEGKEEVEVVSVEEKKVGEEDVKLEVKEEEEFLTVIEEAATEEPMKHLEESANHLEEETSLEKDANVLEENTVVEAPAKIMEEKTAEEPASGMEKNGVEEETNCLGEETTGVEEPSDSEVLEVKPVTEETVEINEVVGDLSSENVVQFEFSKEDNQVPEVPENEGGDSGISGLNSIDKVEVNQESKVPEEKENIEIEEESMEVAEEPEKELETIIAEDHSENPPLDPGGTESMVTDQTPETKPEENLSPSIPELPIPSIVEPKTPENMTPTPRKKKRAPQPSPQVVLNSEPSTDRPMPSPRTKSRRPENTPTSSPHQSIPPKEEYPSELNPFGEEDSPPVPPSPVPKPRTKTLEPNPFDDSEINNNSSPKPSPSPQSSTPTSKPYNPFEEDDDIGSFQDDDRPTGIFARGEDTHSISSKTSDLSASSAAGLQKSLLTASGGGTTRSRKTRRAPLPPGMVSQAVSPEPPASNSPTPKKLIPVSPELKVIKNQVNKVQYRKKRRAPPPRRRVEPLPEDQIKTELKDLEIKQKELERQGISLENHIRQQMASSEQEQESGDRKQEGNDDAVRESSGSEQLDEMIIQLWNIVNEKNDILRRQTELEYLRRSHRLEEMQAELEFQLRILMDTPEEQRQDDHATTEQLLLDELLKLVDERNEVVDWLDYYRQMDREEELEVTKSISKFKSQHTLTEMMQQLKLKPKKGKKEKSSKSSKDKESSNGPPSSLEESGSPSPGGKAKKKVGLFGTLRRKTRSKKRESLGGYDEDKDVDESVSGEK